MTITYSITTDDKALYDKLVAALNGTSAPAATPVAAAPAPAPVAAPVAAPAPTPVAPAPAPVAAPAPAPAAAPQGQPQPGWTIEHVRHALTGLAQNPAKGPAAVAAVLQKFGVSTINELNPAVWHEVYAAAQTA